MGFKPKTILCLTWILGMLTMVFSSNHTYAQNETIENISTTHEVNRSINPPNSVLMPMNKQESDEFEAQLERDRKQQKLTKDLKIRLEQANLELEHAKAMAQINQLRQANGDFFRDPITEENKSFPAIKIDYIGGNHVKKEAILSIGGTTYHVREKSRPISSMQVLGISDTGVKIHFSAPQELIKTIDYRPE